MNKLILIATNEIGVKEISGPAHNKRILQYAQEAGFSHIKDDETPWCSIFMNWAALKAGLERSGKANARSWLMVGQPVEQPEPGDIVIFSRGNPGSWQGHVGIYMGVSVDGTRIYTLGGNQGNQVSQTAYRTDQLLGFRRLKPAGLTTLSPRVLRRGDTGLHVINLQDALKVAGLNPGSSDGIFGQRTEDTIRELQSTSLDLEVNGIFDKGTREYLLGNINKREPIDALV